MGWKKMLTIGLDFDHTITADPEMWSEFIKSAKSRGHRVIIVTYRMETTDMYQMPNDDIFEYAKENDVTIVFTGGNQKRKFCQEHHKLEVDIWIDDSPQYIVQRDEVFDQVLIL